MPPTPVRFPGWGQVLCGAQLRCMGPSWGLVILFVGFSDDRGLIFIWFDVAVLVVIIIITIIIIVVWVSRRHRVAYDEDAPVGQTGGKALGGACGHVRAPMDVATFTLHRNAVRAVHRYLFVQHRSFTCPSRPSGAPTRRPIVRTEAMAELVL